ncbi:MAG: DNA cytosine methyltransferase [Verrucomicrobiota bacterium]
MKQLHLRHLDLFSGGGLFALAARWAGIETVAFSEIEPYANRVLAARFPGIRNLGNIQKLCCRTHECDYDPESDDYLCPRCSTPEWPVAFGDCQCIGADEYADDFGFPDIITAGFPCQGASVAGHGLGLDDPRTGLWYETLRVTRELRPRFLLLENVPGLRTRGADEILEGLAAADYAAEPFVVGARDVGASHRRDRVWIVAYDTTFGIQGLRPARFEKSHALAPPPLPLRRGDGQWEVEPDLRRAPHADPRWMDRLKVLGNAVTPHIPVLFFDFMRQTLNAQRHH